MYTAESSKKLILYSTLIGATAVVLAFSFNPKLLNMISPNNIGSVLGSVSSEEPVVQEKPSVFNDDLKPIYAEPKRLYINSLGIDIEVIEVGVEADGTMEAPADWNVGGWYMKSTRPGELGNMIINAHYDNNYGAPASFFQLKNAKINDRVFIVDRLGKVYTYKITNLFYIDILDPDRLKIFEDVHDRAELTLITCGGVWIPGEGYNKRLVVKSELVSH